MLEQSKEEQTAQEAQEGKNVVRQSASEYLAEILGKEYWKIWRN